MYYPNYNYWGMDILWWFVWGFMLFWIFFIPYDVPFQRMKQSHPLLLLRKRLALGEINEAEYREMRNLLKS